MNMSIASWLGLTLPILSNCFQGMKMPRSYSGTPSRKKVKMTGLASLMLSQKSVCCAAQLVGKAAWFIDLAPTKEVHYADSKP